MNSIKRAYELILIMIIAWTTIIIFLFIADRYIVPIKLPGYGYMKALLESILKLTLSGALAMVWLQLWIQLIKRYVKRTGH